MDLLLTTLAQELHVKPQYVQAVVSLLDEGNTVPFIARYRKEQHGAMDDQTIRLLSDRLSGGWRPGKGRCSPPLRARAG